ncbi:nucleotide-diphospho-sugar transferase [Mycena sanguinolenta]|nr:nucleotide-diphospho-sugar transferase [Mycena sanguinolenta]
MALKGAYATLLTKVSYLAGTLVLWYGLKESQSAYPLVVMVTPELEQDARYVLDKFGIRMIEIQSLLPEDGAHKLAEADKRFHDTWTKLRAFELVEFDRVVLLDSDMVVKKNIDHLMTMKLPQGGIAAAHVCACNPRKFKHYPDDWIPENCAHTVVSSPTEPPPAPTDKPRPYGQLNSGTVVLEPSPKLAKELSHFLATDKRVSEWSFPDQDLLTAFFHGNWTSLPWYYNALKTLRNIHPQLWDDDVARCVHYILPEKPWHVRLEDSEFKVVDSWWWAQYQKMGEKLQAEDVDAWKIVSAVVVS